MYAKHSFYFQTLFSLGPSAKGKNAPLASFFMKQKALQAKGLSNKMRRRPDFVIAS